MGAKARNVLEDCHPIPLSLHRLSRECYASCARVLMDIQFTTRIFKEGRTCVAHAMELDVSSCGGSKEKALKNLVVS